MTSELEDPAPDRVTWWGAAWRLAFCVVFGAFMWVVTVAEVVGTDGRAPEELRGAFLIFLDPVIGLVCTFLVLGRRRWPLTIASVTAVLSAVSMSSVGAQTLTLCSVSTRRRWREIVVVVLLATGAGVTSTRFHPELEPLALWAETLFNLFFVGIIAAVGYAIGARRALVRSWYERARTSEAEQRARVAQARAAERTRIAREMHDVLAHRISLVTMHAGVLSYREDLPDDERRAAVAAIDANSRAALTDLREVLGVLRDPATVDGPARPQSDLQDLDELLDEASSAGARVRVDTGGVDLPAVPESTSRTAYRVLQEALTNARKHAPDTVVTVRLAGGPDHGLDITVTNPRPVRTPAGVPGSGMGLLGLTERVELAGGRLEHGWRTDEEHRLAVWLPWPA